MDLTTARKLMGELMKCYQALETAELIAAGIEERDEGGALIKAIVLAATDIEESLMTPIVKQYPELNPFSSTRPRTF